MNDYQEISIPHEVEEKIEQLSVRLDFTRLNLKQWKRLETVLNTLHNYISIYKTELTSITVIECLESSIKFLEGRINNPAIKEEYKERKIIRLRELKEELKEMVKK